LDLNQQPRNSTWLHKADLVFVVRSLFFHASLIACHPIWPVCGCVLCIYVPEMPLLYALQDTPVGTGYSYEEDASGKFVRRSVPQTFSEAAADILELLRVLTGAIPTLQIEQPPVPPPFHLWRHLRWQDYHRRRKSHLGRHP
jgi:hypothetical protein